ncbi:MAG: tRNA (adenosine(37)-N6)-threonylcarbamoyltransferase complex dimerization subunit type 1 TsaB [Prevotella sp.]|nr:tRNA (adenosine(37)-N6)-threonylcarbamoyltransferase complex dimerization subunit type 1 TsaB [Prevotella sp.]
MATIIHIETSTDVCSVAVSKDGFRLFDRTIPGSVKGSQASEQLGTLVEEAIDEAREKPDAVAVSSGPGSYTGLRIGMSMAKGLAYGSDAKLIAVPTLELLCVPVLLGDYDMPDDALLCPMIDARRMEVFTAVYDRALRPVMPVQAMVVDENSFKDLLKEHDIYFFGNGAKKCMDTINHLCAHYIDGITPQAKNMLPLADKRFHEEKFEDVAYFTPEYYKQYEAKLPKNLLKL